MADTAPVNEPPPPAATERTQLRAALAALHHAGAAVRLHPAGHRVRQDALRQFASRMLVAAAAGPLNLDLIGSQVVIDGEPVWADGDQDGILARLTRIGIGRLTVARGITAKALIAFAELLAQDLPRSAPDDDLVSRWQQLQLDGIDLRAAVGPAPAQATATPSPWAALPPAGRAARDLEPAVAHELAANLPVIAARWLLADLEAAPVDGALVTARLTPLVAALLARREVSGCAWLVDAVQQHPAIAPETALEVRGRVQTAFAGPWLADLLADGSVDATSLLALAMQLGDASVQGLVATAERVGRPLPAWLLDMIPKS